MSILVRVEVDVVDSRIGEFRELAEQVTAATEAEPGTIQYRWFTREKPSAFVLIEEYDDEEAALAHNRNCAELAEKLATVTTVTRIDAHGDLSEDMTRELAAHPGAATFPPLFA